LVIAAMSKPLGGRSISTRLKNGENLGEIILHYETFNAKQINAKSEVSFSVTRDLQTLW